MNTLEGIKAAIWEVGSVNREHLLAFLQLQDTSDGPELARRTETFLRGLHADPFYSRVMFPVDERGDHVNLVLDDLKVYGRATNETIADMPANTVTEVPSA